MTIDIFTSLSKLASNFLDPSVTEALTAFVLKPSSCTAESRHSVGLNRFPKRECFSS